MFEKEVARGARALDNVKPGWFNKINTGRLEMRGCDKCIIGQLIGHSKAKTFFTGWESNEISASDLGFTVKLDHIFSYSAWDRLKEAWVQEINRRRSAETIMSDALSAVAGKDVPQHALLGE